MVRHFLRDDKPSPAEFVHARAVLLTWFLERSAS
jgi:hypothetical protein